jgi:hypothetical protein
MPWEKELKCRYYEVPESTPESARKLAYRTNTTEYKVQCTL